MSNFALYFSLFSTWFAIPCLAIIGVIFWKKQSSKESLVLASGLVLLAIGSLIQVFSPFAELTIDEAGKVLTSEAPLSWYTGSIVTSIGLIFTVIGFALVAMKLKK